MKLFPCTMEIILVSPSMPSSYDKKLLDRHRNYHNISWLLSEPGRAHQLNAGAGVATRKFLWFLHADSHFNKKSLVFLAKSLQNKERALHYFRLAFLPDGSRFLMSITTLGVYLRTKFLKLPWGDQGFCLTKKLFMELGKYPKHVSSGEDHSFVWKVKRKNIPLQPINAVLYTSARKYAENGWLATTWLHFRKALVQIYTECLQSSYFFRRTTRDSKVHTVKRKATTVKVYPTRTKIIKKAPEKTL